MHPKDLRISDYTYILPPDKIAKYPMSERDQSKLLIYKDDEIKDDIYSNIMAYIPAKSLMIFNNTQVIHARLFFNTTTGARVEIFCLEPADEKADMAIAMNTKGAVRWKCLVGRASKWKEKVLERKEADFTLTAELVDRTADSFIVEFKWQPHELTFAEILDRAGVMPIPPYLHRGAEEIDNTRYQTLYAREQGSVAAPTAGLHFTEGIFKALKEKNVEIDYVTLHVGAGTFKPVKSETMNEHEMHMELIYVQVSTIRKILNSVGETIIAAGTTSMRTIESIYWMGVKAKLYPAAKLEQLEIKQWDAYELDQQVSVNDALTSLIDWMERNQIETLICKTQIIIAPGYSLRIVGALATNFHMPGSTLLLLVAAMVGDKWKEIYDYALHNNFRFLSYGDGSLLFRK